uniref:Putative glycosyltransferase n=1 Tax=viral metagenome TaxID=1070528 RepID=A0A6M3IZM7_9ZZZZ
MKLIWLSVAPWALTGYGVVTREIVSRMIKEGHEVTVACKHFHTGTVVWEGIPTIQGMNVNILNRMIDKGEADYIITLLDNHALPGIPKKWISYTPFDTETLPESIRRTLDEPLMIIALTKHGQKEIESAGYDCLYAPHGVDTHIYCPNEEKRKEERKVLGWEDNFIIGTVGVNYPDDRKNFVNLVRAFKDFHDKHDEARLFLVSNSADTDGSDYLPMCISNLGLNQLVKWTHPDSYFKGEVTSEMMANRYRGMDLFCMPTRGEGFGIPLIEAQACCVPVVTTSASTGPELCPTQYLIPVGKHEWQWFNNNWRPNVSPGSIYNSLEYAYNDQKRALRAEEGYRRIVTQYDWDYIFDVYWKPILKQIEGLKVKVQSKPNYRHLYETFDGRITMSDCGRWCGNLCPKTFALLPGEKETDRPILSRSFPIVPNSEGELYVETACPLYQWLSRKFKKEAKETWRYLCGFPRIRDFLKTGILANNCVLPLDSIRQTFNEDYKWAMQSQYYTNFPDIGKYVKGSVLEVGCGDGSRVKTLRDKGIMAWGIDVNPAHVSDWVNLGNAEALEFGDNGVDTVYSVDVLEHLENPLKALSEMFRVSRNLVINSITPVDDPCFMQDPTHKVEWDRERWKREINEFGELIDILEPFTIVARKRR